MRGRRKKKPLAAFLFSPPPPPLDLFPPTAFRGRRRRRGVNAPKRENKTASQFLPRLKRLRAFCIVGVERP